MRSADRKRSRKLASVTIAHMRLLRDEGHTYTQIANIVQRHVSVVHRALVQDAVCCADIDRRT